MTILIFLFAFTVCFITLLTFLKAATRSEPPITLTTRYPDFKPGDQVRIMRFDGARDEGMHTVASVWGSTITVRTSPWQRLRIWFYLKTLSVATFLKGLCR